MTHMIVSQEETVSVSPFDLLPDDVLLSIFQKLLDAKSLCLSMCACKRFRDIAPRVDEISYDMAHKKPQSQLEESSHETQKSSFRNLLAKSLMKPFRYLSHMVKLKSKNEENNDLDDFFSFHVPNRVLKPFETVRSLHLRLPTYRPKQSSKHFNSSNFLKWEADYVSELRSCVILGAKSWDVNGTEPTTHKEESLQETEQVMSEDELKLRVVWTISCLIAASARHYLIQETVRDQKSIESIVVSDDSEQGRLCMNTEGIREMREHLIKEKKALSPSTSSSDDYDDDELVMEYRSKLPALKMMMWHLDRVKVSESDEVMKGATLVVIRPASDVEEDVKKMKCEELVMGAFGEDLVLCDVVRKLMAAKKCYTLEMNSF